MYQNRLDDASPSTFLENIGTRTVLIFLLFAGLIPSGMSLLINIFTMSNQSIWLEGWLQNFSTEMFGGLLTFILFDLIIGQREKRREQQTRIRQQQASDLSRLKASRSNDERQAILDEMSASDTLQYADLSGMVFNNLRFDNMNLAHANLSRIQAKQCSFINTNLSDANLEQSIFIQVNMTRSDCQGVNLERATLTNANLTGCDLMYSNLWGINAQGVILRNARLRHSRMWGADIRGCDLTGADYDDETLSGVIRD